MQSLYARLWFVALAFIFGPAVCAGQSLPLPNGGSVSGLVAAVGQVVSYTFTTNAGEAVGLRAATSDGNLLPCFTVFNPSGGQAGFGDGGGIGGVSTLTISPTVTGTYTISVYSCLSNSTGSFVLHYVKVPGANEGGLLLNGGQPNAGTITLGDLDSFTFTANVGEIVQLRTGTTSGTLAPCFGVRGPTGAFVGGSSIASLGGVGALSINPPTSGTYTVVVADCSSSALNGTGTYNLYYTKAPGANEGGLLLNGGQPNSGTIDRGDLDSFTFTANVGEIVQLRTGTTSGTLAPCFNVYGPTGAFVGNSSPASLGGVGALSINPPTSGTYTVVVADCRSSAFDGTGTYNLYYTRAPGANEGGFLNDGLARSNQIDIGDLDSYTVSANAGDSILGNVQRIGSPTLVTEFRVYNPSGGQVGQSSCGGAGTISFAASTTGVYTIVVADCSSTGFSGTGPYTIQVTGATGIPPNTDADVPIPLWALVLLAAMLGGGSLIRNRSVPRQ